MQQDNEIQKAMAGQIEDRVLGIRTLKASIAEREVESGITVSREQIEVLRGELLELVREHKTLTGENWEDGEGFARYVSAGESHKYDTKSIDDALAKLMALSADIGNAIGDNGFELIPDEDGNVSDREAFDQLSRYYAAKMEELQMKLEYMDHILKDAAAARTVKHTKERVAVR
jgi:hypothetical protein